jgi:hypothetical protein
MKNRIERRDCCTGCGGLLANGEHGAFGCTETEASGILGIGAERLPAS